MLYTSFLICVFAGYSAASYVEGLQKCSIKDDDCMVNTFRGLIKDFGRNGSPELDIAVFDPYKINNVTVSLFSALDFTMDKGTVEGMSDCVLDVYTINIEKGSGHMKITCSPVIEGLYNITSNAIVQILLKTYVHGNGHAKIVTDGAQVSVDFAVHVQKHDDGETYLKTDFKNLSYDYNVPKIHFEADNIILDGIETSETAIAFLNHNAKFVMKTFGKPFVDKAVEIATEFCGKFQNAVPAKYYISDDLSSYAQH